MASGCSWTGGHLGTGGKMVSSWGAEHRPLDSPQQEFELVRNVSQGVFGVMAHD
jgi:hypothetical protein